MVKGWVGTVHSHPHEQVVYVVHGHLKITCQGRTVDVRTGTLSLCAVAWSTVHRNRGLSGSRRIHAVQRRLHSLKRFVT